ncbi:MAG TPA: ATP-binding protein [Ktedonobacteraceae bacterium]|nr:ATP-binding protein [Ktedonobacteraceae bacterium]
MNWNRPAWWPPLRRSRLSREPGAALFQGLRARLTLWYCGVLGVALVLFGVTLYFSTQYFLISPVASNVQMHADAHKSQWVTGGFDHACPLDDAQKQFGAPPGLPMPELILCFDQNGNLLPNEYTDGVPSAFLSTNLVRMALQTGQPASGIVDAGGTTGKFYLYAQVVPGPAGSGNTGALLVGEPVQAQESALALLLKLLLGIGAVALLGAGVGGLFLSNRALAPARLSWSNQQRFIADAAHELRTPLTLLRADAEVLLRGRKRLEEEDAALLEDIVAEANHMSNLATNLLTLARLDNGTMHREHEVVSLAALAHEGARRVQAFAEQRGVTVQVESSDEAYVIGDPLLLEQAMLVLLDNAIKYNRQGGRVIVRTAEQDRQTLLEVRDMGIGIAAEHLPHLGERFYRVDKARSREAGGTGLGLSIAQRIALAHGGRLSIASIAGQGTTVMLALPPAHTVVREDLEENDSSLPEKTL